jgi:hypothetical protein
MINAVLFPLYCNFKCLDPVVQYFELTATFGIHAAIILFYIIQKKSIEVAYF